MRGLNDAANWTDDEKQDYAASEKRLTSAASGGAVNNAFYSAALIAKRAARDDGLIAFTNTDGSGEPVYTVEQARKAACHAREDVAALLYLQLPLLHAIRWVIWIGLASLGLHYYSVAKRNVAARLVRRRSPARAHPPLAEDEMWE